MQTETKELYGITNPHNTGRNYLSYWGDRNAQNGGQEIPQRARMDKQELRRRWQQVVDAVNPSNSRSDPNPNLGDYQAVIEQTNQRPYPCHTPGGKGKKKTGKNK